MNRVPVPNRLVTKAALILGAIAYGIGFGEFVMQPLDLFLNSLDMPPKISNLITLLCFFVPMGALLGKAKGSGTKREPE